MVAYAMLDSAKCDTNSTNVALVDGTGQHLMDLQKTVKSLLLSQVCGSGGGS